MIVALLVDADRQGSSRFWAQTRSSLRLPRLDSTPLYGEMVARQIATIASRYDDMVIDTGAADERDRSGHNVSLSVVSSKCTDRDPLGCLIWEGSTDGHYKSYQNFIAAQEAGEIDRTAQTRSGVIIMDWYKPLTVRRH